MKKYLLILSACLAASAVSAAPSKAAVRYRAPEHCSDTANLVWRACGLEVADSYLLSIAYCGNLDDSAERRACVEEASTARSEGTQTCAAQHEARDQICDEMGESRYDPDFAPANFESDFRNLVNTNRYFPLGIGNRWEYAGSSEKVQLEVLNRTKLIEGVNCLVVRDQVFKNGQLAEDTDDWFAQGKDGSVWYCGEEVKDYESFATDRPPTPELVSIDGSFKAGRDGARPGIIFQGNPTVGMLYREEFSLANAEDVSRVVSTTYRRGTVPALDRGVPAALMNLLCRGDCVVLDAFTAQSPGVVERKFFAPGIGFIFQINLRTAVTVQLVRCNFDSRCANLPQL